MTEKWDRRAQPRRKDRIALEFNYAQQRCAVNTMDVSTAGALIRTPVAFPSGTLLILEAPSLCGEECRIRLLARVVRASQHGGDPGAIYSGLALTWIRAYSMDGPAALRRFLVETLGFPTGQDLDIQHAVSGDAVFDFPAGPAVIEPRGPALAATRTGSDMEEYEERRARFVRHLTGRFQMDSPVIYSVNNMHYRGVLVALGPDSAAFKVRGALPFPGAKVNVRYALENSPSAPRLVFFAVAEMVLEPYGSEAGFFSARLDGIDEAGQRGLFASHLNGLKAAKTPRW